MEERENIMNRRSLFSFLAALPIVGGAFGAKASQRVVDNPNPPLEGPLIPLSGHGQLFQWRIQHASEVIHAEIDFLQKEMPKHLPLKDHLDTYPEMVDRMEHITKLVETASTRLAILRAASGEWSTIYGNFKLADRKPVEDLIPLRERIKRVPLRYLD